jgi:hypothetical protein
MSSLPAITGHCILPYPLSSTPGFRLSTIRYHPKFRSRRRACRGKGISQRCLIRTDEAAIHGTLNLCDENTGHEVMNGLVKRRRFILRRCGLTSVILE